MFDHPFLVHAFVGGTAIAMACGLVGYFLVLRSQVFAADAISHVAFTGSVAALAFGIDARIGVVAAVLFVAVLLGAVGPRGGPDDVTIGSVFVWVLGLGVLFLSLFTARHATANSTAGVGALFGSIFGLDAGRTAIVAGVSAFVCAAMVWIARPLLFATVDEAVAARGVPVALLSYAFLVLVALTAAQATQAVGALLLLGLLAAPAGAAIQLTARPFRAFGLSAALAVAGVWGGLFISYRWGRVPPSFTILATVTAEFILALAVGRIPRHQRTRGAIT